MTNTSNLTDEQRSIIEKVQKLMRLASKNANEHEAANATAKAMELLAAYNLDASIVGSAEDGSLRKEERSLGGAHEWQRDLWHWVAELNFCLYFTVKRWSRRANGKGRERLRSHHVIIGRTVNVASTRVMANYLEEAIDRLVSQRFPGNRNEWYSSEILAYREGVADTVIYKLYNRRQEVLDAEKAKLEKEAREAAERAERAGISTSTAMTLASFSQAEKDANMDFAMGEVGYSARVRAERVAKAKAAAEAEAEYTRWAEANPEEARRQEEERQKESQKRSSEARSRESGRDRRRSSTLYWGGRDAGEAIGIDPQIKEKDDTRLLG